MSDEIKYTLNVQSVDNPLTKEVGDRRFVLVSNGTADFDRVISEIMSVNPGLEREAVEAVVKLEHRTIMRLTLSGMRVSNGLFSAVASPKGRAGASWNPEVNQLNITIAQGADWREAIRNTTVNVLGDKAEVMYISGTTDIATRATDRTATPGYPFTVEGNYLKLVGDDPAVGITIVSEEGTETRVDSGMVAVNEPKKLVFVLPAGLAEGTYTLRIATQYGGSNSNILRKTPRVVESPLYIGVAPTTPDDDGEDSGEDDGDHQLG